VPPAPLVELHLSYSKSKTDYISSEDNDYKNNNGFVISIPHKEEENNDSAKPFAKLLIVDDDSDVVKFLKLGLPKNKFLIKAFTNPEEALEDFKFNSKSYRLILSDVQMPTLDGIQLARKVKEINADVKVVLMTGLEIRDIESSKVFPSTDVDGFVQKPFHMKDLTNRILDTMGETQDE
jgi:DNA-binding response OmpR family regulator